MASSTYGDVPDTVPLPTAPRQRPAGSMWSLFMARFRAEPIAQPFHDSDFEPTDWSATEPFVEPERRRPT